MSDAQFRPQGKTRLVPGHYTLAVVGPQGIILNLTMDLARRAAFECLLDDARMQELLVVTSVAAAVIDAELMDAKEGAHA